MYPYHVSRITDSYFIVVVIVISISAYYTACPYVYSCVTLLFEELQSRLNGCTVTKFDAQYVLKFKLPATVFEVFV